VSSRYEAFRQTHENWQEILDAYKDVKQVEKVTGRTYLLQQRELEKIYEAMQIQAERAHLLHFEVMFSVVASTIFQNDALHRLYFSPGLKNVSPLSR
jgi:hypothetical protein